MRFFSTFFLLLAAAAPAFASVLTFDDLPTEHVAGCGCCLYYFSATESYHGFLISGPSISAFNATVTFSCRQSPGGFLNLHGASSPPAFLQSRAGNATFTAAGDAGSKFAIKSAKPSTRYRIATWGKPDAWVYVTFKARDEAGEVVAQETRKFLTSTDEGGLGPWDASGLETLGSMSSLVVNAEWLYLNVTSTAELYLDDLEYEFEE